MLLCFGLVDRQAKLLASYCLSWQPRLSAGAAQGRVVWCGQVAVGLQHDSLRMRVRSSSPVGRSCCLLSLAWPLPPCGFASPAGGLGHVLSGLYNLRTRAGLVQLPGSWLHVINTKQHGLLCMDAAVAS